MKNIFSSSPGQYAKYRPDYPQALFDFIYPLLSNKECAWDCGTGNGQLAIELAKEFRKVKATDISEEQLQHAFTADNVEYSVQAAESTCFEDNSFDLITVAQAVHWFEIDKFNEELAPPAETLYLVCSILSKADGYLHVYTLSSSHLRTEPSRRHIPSC